MEKINKLLDFLFEHLEDNRITVHKKFKYGFKNYYLNFYIDEDPNKNQTQNQHNFFRYRDSLEILFDNRNKCIEIYGGNEDHPLIIEDETLLQKWSSILEEVVSKNLEERCVDIFEKTLSECYNKDLYRELQIKKLFKEDESL